MTLTVRLFGRELLAFHVDLSTDTPAESGPGDCTAMPMGFVARTARGRDARPRLVGGGRSCR